MGTVLGESLGPLCQENLFGYGHKLTKGNWHELVRRRGSRPGEDGARVCGLGAVPLAVCVGFQNNVRPHVRSVAVSSDRSRHRGRENFWIRPQTEQGQLARTGRTMRVAARRRWGLDVRFVPVPLNRVSVFKKNSNPTRAIRPTAMTYKVAGLEPILIDQTVEPALAGRSVA
jgi:hypothetical protein